MIRAVLVGVVALLASANAFLAPVPGYKMPRTARSTAPVQMVTSPRVSTPAVSNPTGGGGMQSSEATYTAALKKMEAECLEDLEKAFDDTAKKAQAESEKIWKDLEAEFDADEPDTEA